MVFFIDRCYTYGGVQFTKGAVMYGYILWDIDGTVLNFLEAEKAAIRKCFEIHGLGTCTDEMLSEYSQINMRYWEMLERGEMSKHDILVGRFREFFKAHGLPADAAEPFNDDYQIRLGDTVVFNDNAPDILRRLKGCAVQCAVTNGTKIAQERKLERSGLNKIFDYVFISEDLGFEKPDKRYFDAVFEALGAPDPKEMIIIGDSLTSDIKGGINAGIDTCWYNPDRKKADSGAVYEISDLSELTAPGGILYYA